MISEDLLVAKKFKINEFSQPPYNHSIRQCAGTMLTEVDLLVLEIPSLVVVSLSQELP